MKERFAYKMNKYINSKNESMVNILIDEKRKKKVKNKNTHISVKH